MDDSFSKAFGDFIKVFTVKRVIVLAVVGVILVLLCGSHQEDNVEPNDCSESSCPFPRHGAK